MDWPTANHSREAKTVASGFRPSSGFDHLPHRIPAMLSPSAVAAEGAAPDSIELLLLGADERGGVRPDAILEVARSERNFVIVPPPPA